MTLIRQLVDVLAAPLVIALLLALAGFAARLAGRRRLGWSLLTCAAVLAYLFSTSLVGRALLHPLETKYPPLAEMQPPPVAYVVVLGSGYEPRDGIPVTAALDEDGVVRVVEAVRLARLLPQSRLVVSGGAVPGHVPTALGYARLAQALGIPAQSIVVSDRAVNTRGEARDIENLLGRSPFLLVTSAYHMPRAMLLMRQAGAKAIAAPTEQRSLGPGRVTLRDFLPGSGGLKDSERALHEYVGLAADASGLE
jgi:uncharacterized SAM-binding protein YcdF (DUF218 family)